MRSKEKYMIKKNLILIVVAALFGGVAGGFSRGLNLRSNMSSSHVNTMAQGTESTKEKGCLSCHNGIETINDRMQPFLLSFAKQKYGKRKGYECAICHEGNPASGKKEEAHSTLIPNPSSMWVLHEGKGCAKCHDSKGSITTLMGKPLSQPVGGELMSGQLLSSEPSGVLGIDYTYRMSMSLHSLMTGIASKTLSSNGIIPKGTFPYGNFDTIDTDGQIPRVGSEKYKAWVGAAIKSGFMRIVDKVDEIPDFKNGVNLFGSEENAGFSDTYRKQCARCHVWGEGRNQRGDLRASGCASCHVLYGNDGKYEGNDPTIKNTETRPHPLRHRITTAIPSAQCTHCHTRGRLSDFAWVGGFGFTIIAKRRAPALEDHAKPQET